MPGANHTKLLKNKCRMDAPDKLTRVKGKFDHNTEVSGGSVPRMWTRYDVMEYSGRICLDPESHVHQWGQECAPFTD
jgi:hypothetical protein